MLRINETTIGTDTQAGRTFDHVAVVVSTLREVSDGLDTPFLRTISGVAALILTTVQSVRTNKEECAQMVEDISEIISAIIRLCVDANGVLPPSILDSIGRFTETLQKFQSFMRTQQDQGKLKRLFKNQENTAQLEECKAALKQALDVFAIRTGVDVVAATAGLEIDAEHRQAQILANEYTSDGSSLISETSSFRYGSSF
ncbi:hypothetical protein FB451DRAFT_136279 [Mycena latifolia]|nr:hypothetical protein FB451DRAFT_136279 [Mycena latifolia]